MIYFWLFLIAVIVIIIAFVKFWTWFNITHDGFVKAHKWMVDHDQTFPRPDTFGNVGKLANLPIMAMHNFQRIMSGE